MNGNASRLKAVENINKQAKASVNKTELLDDIWATDVFNLAKMESVLSKDAFASIKKTIQTGKALEQDTAEEIAAAGVKAGAEFNNASSMPLSSYVVELQQSVAK